MTESESARRKRLSENRKRNAKYRRLEAQELALLDEVAKRVPVELAAKPTTGKPGSERKLLRMAARYRHGLPLYVKGDA